MIYKLMSSAGLALLIAACAAPPAPEKTVPRTEIKIGNTSPQTGPAQAYGSVSRTLGDFFKKVNEDGGVNGLPVRFVIRDDGYDPPRSRRQSRSLVEGGTVDLFAGSIGTPTQLAVRKYLNDTGIPQIMVVSAHPSFNQPDRFPWTMGFLPSYEVEGMVFGQWIRTNHPDRKIAVLFQDDSFGQSYLRGLRNGLGTSEDNLIALESYQRSDVSVARHTERLANSGAQVFVNISVPKFAAQAIRTKAEKGWQAVHLLASVSTSMTSTIKPAGNQNASGIISTSYLKDPTDPMWNGDAEVREYRSFLAAYSPGEDKDSAFNVFSYAFGHVLLDILKRSGPDYSHEAIMRAATSIKDVDPPMFLPGIKVNTAPGDHVPISALWMTRFDGTAFQALEGPIEVNCCRPYAE